MGFVRSFCCFLLTLNLLTFIFTVGGVSPASADPDPQADMDEEEPSLQPKNLTPPILKPKSLQLIPPKIDPFNPIVPPSAPLLNPRLKTVPRSPFRRLTTKNLEEVHESQSQSNFSLGLLLITPLIKQNSYDARFSTFGLQVPVGIPMLSMRTWSLEFETGITITYSSLSLSQPVVDFSHLYLELPLYAKVRFGEVFNPGLFFDAFVGVHAKIFEYDSRPTLDGGFHLVTDGIFSNLDGDFGMGLNYKIGDSSFLRLKLSYLFAGIGVEWGL